ncbi:FAD-dependent oxidoreductase, partial [Aerococcus urinae]
CEIILVDMAPTVLGPFDEKSRNAAHRALEDRGVKVLLNQAVSAVEENRILVKNTKTEEEQWIDASLIVWSSGVGVPP